MYRKQGYIIANATYTPKLDDATRRAGFALRVEEGPQFRMGTLEFAACPARTRNLKKKWQLKQGDVFEIHPRKFEVDEASALRRGGSPPRLEPRSSTRRVVNVRFVFK